MKKKLLIIFSLLILAGSLLLQSVSLQVEQEHIKKEAHLKNYLPETLAGWKVDDVPLGRTEAVKSASEKTLNFDEYINKRYSNGNQYFAVFMAYWGTGKMAPQLVATHNPDRCWTKNGWTCVDSKFDHIKTVDEKNLLPGQWRYFKDFNDSPHYVMFWHLVGGEVYDYGGKRLNDNPSPIIWLKDSIKSKLVGIKEQYFIRVNSNVPLEQLWDKPKFQEVMKSISELGLIEKID